LGVNLYKIAETEFEKTEKALVIFRGRLILKELLKELPKAFYPNLVSVISSYVEIHILDIVFDSIYWNEFKYFRERINSYQSSSYLQYKNSQNFTIFHYILLHLPRTAEVVNIILGKLFEPVFNVNLSKEQAVSLGSIGLLSIGIKRAGLSQINELFEKDDLKAARDNLNKNELFLRRSRNISVRSYYILFGIGGMISNGRKLKGVTLTDVVDVKQPLTCAIL